MGRPVAAHETHARHRRPVAAEQHPQHFVVQHFARIGLQVGAVAARAAVGAPRNVYRQRRFTGYLGENHIVVAEPYHPATPRHRIAVFAVPLGVLHPHVFGRNHFAVEHQLLRAVFLIVALHQPQHFLHERRIAVVVVDAQPQEFGRLDQPVHPHGQILPRKVYVTRIEEREHPF